MVECEAIVNTEVDHNNLDQVSSTIALMMKMNMKEEKYFVKQHSNLIQTLIACIFSLLDQKILVKDN